jgi:hypothetical protein
MVNVEALSRPLFRERRLDRRRRLAEEHEVARERRLRVFLLNIDLRETQHLLL